MGALAPTLLVRPDLTRALDEDTITFVANQALEGDWVELVSDGTNWYVSGQINVVEALTFTAT